MLTADTDARTSGRRALKAAAWLHALLCFPCKPRAVVWILLAVKRPKSISAGLCCNNNQLHCTLHTFGWLCFEYTVLPCTRMAGCVHSAALRPSGFLAHSAAPPLVAKELPFAPPTCARLPSQQHSPTSNLPLFDHVEDDTRSLCGHTTRTCTRTCTRIRTRNEAAAGRAARESVK